MGLVLFDSLTTGFIVLSFLHSDISFVHHSPEQRLCWHFDNLNCNSSRGFNILTLTFTHNQWETDTQTVCHRILGSKNFPQWAKWEAHRFTLLSTHIHPWDKHILPFTVTSFRFWIILKVLLPQRPWTHHTGHTVFLWWLQNSVITHSVFAHTEHSFVLQNQEHWI